MTENSEIVMKTSCVKIFRHLYHLFVHNSYRMAGLYETVLFLYVSGDIMDHLTEGLHLGFVDLGQAMDPARVGQALEGQTFRCMVHHLA